MPTKLRAIFDIVFLTALIVYIVAGVPLVPFHGDESTLIHTTRDYAYQFIERDYNMITLNGHPAIDPMDQQLRLIDGRVHKYLGGLAWHVGGYSVDDINTAWLWGTDWDYNRREGHIPSDDILIITRYASALLMAAGVVVMFFIGKSVGGRPAGYAAAFLYAINPALLVNGRRSMMEGSLMFFSLLTVLAGMWFVRRLPPLPALLGERGEKQENHTRTGNNGHHKKRLYSEDAAWVFSVLALGLAAGLALSSKHTAVFTLVPVFAACGLYALYQRHFAAIGGLVAAGMVALVVFYVLNPTWWGDPLSGFNELLRLRTETLNTQLLYFDSYDGMGEKLGGFVRYALNSHPQYYEIAEWEGFIGGQIAAYENSMWTGLALPLVAVIGLLLAGVAGLVRRFSPQRWVIGLWGVVAIAAVISVTPFEWQRYYLPAILPVVVIMGVGVGYIFDVLLGRHILNVMFKRT
jgi:4-amino-4-deoxy-L-arabinose transferase-like glycosyltransferase